MLKKILTLLIIIAFISCNRSNKFTVSGIITNAENQTLYFEYNGLMKDSIIDSVKLTKTGNFKFQSKSPKYTDLFQLRIDNQQIILGIDSTEHIQIKANGNNLIDADISNSIPSTDIQNMRKSVLNLQLKVNEISKISDAAKQKAALELMAIDIEKHKTIVKANILKNTQSIAAYFSLYQQINGYYIFSPFDKEDRKYCAAVATAYDTYMPEYERSKNLRNFVLAALQQNKVAEQQQLLSQLQNKSGIGFPNIELTDNKGNVRNLSDLKGKTIVLDFSSTEMENKVAYTFELRDIFNQYYGKGLQIFQVSVDQNKMLWEQNTLNLPWISVRDENGASTKYLDTYNIQSIPTLFLIDKTGNIVGRYYDFETLKADIKKAI